MDTFLGALGIGRVQGTGGRRMIQLEKDDIRSGRIYIKVAMQCVHGL
jgi:hypothetical protein